MLKTGLDQHRVCSQVCNHTSDVIAMTKNSLYKQKQMSIEDAYNFTTKLMVDNLQLDGNKKRRCFFL